MQTELVSAVRTRKPEAVEAALARGVNVNEKDSKGETALIKAAVRKGCEDIARLLLDNGAFIDEKNNFGNTALIKAVTAKNPEMVRFLIDNNASLTETNKKGYTAQSMAEALGYSETALMLKEAAETRRLDAKKARIAASHALALKNQASLYKTLPRLRIR